MMPNQVKGPPKAVSHPVRCEGRKGVSFSEITNIMGICRCTRYSTC